MATTKSLVDCPKCGGGGRIQQYGHIDEGICYQCKGRGKIVVRSAAQAARIEAQTPKFKVGDRVQLTRVTFDRLAHSVVDHYFPLSPTGRFTESGKAIKEPRSIYGEIKKVLRERNANRYSVLWSFTNPDLPGRVRQEQHVFHQNELQLAETERDRARKRRSK